VLIAKDNQLMLREDIVNFFEDPHPDVEDGKRQSILALEIWLSVIFSVE